MKSRFRPRFVLLFLLRVTKGTLLEYSCPEPNTPNPQAVPSGLKIKLSISGQGQLCTLTLTNKNQVISPLGRSYGGGEWETVAGSNNRLEYECSEGYCTVTIPQDNDLDHVYSLNSFEHTLTRKETIARFLEQTSFGSTLNDIENLESTAAQRASLNHNFAIYLSEQINDIQPTYHRELWRKNTSPRIESSDIEGRVTHPCEKGSRWRRFAFTEKDVSKTLRIKKDDGRFALSVNAHTRTMVDSFQLKSNADFNFSQGSKFTICDVTSKTMSIEYEGSCELLKGGNPLIDMTNNQSEMLILLSQSDFESSHVNPDNMSFTTSKSIEDDLCRVLPLPEVGMAPIFAKTFDGKYYIHDPHLIWVENTVDEPYEYSTTPGFDQPHSKVLCANAPQTFLNEKSCIMTPVETDCTSHQAIGGSVILDNEKVISLHQATGRYVYAVKNLRVEDDYSVESPCTPGTISRWVRKWNGCEANVDISTEKIFSKILRKFDANNQILKDIRFPYNKSCLPREEKLKSIEVQVDGICWQSVHPDYGNVYDFSLLAEDGVHPGNQGAKNPIKNFAESGLSDLTYPESHAMSRWNLSKSKLFLIGKLGHRVKFRDFPDQLRTRESAIALGIHDARVEESSVLTCGSPGEVANVATNQSIFDVTRKQSEDTTSRKEFISQRGTVWTTIALTAKDQLRQRMAWALSQILVISPGSIPVDTNTENFLNYYDIFVRNAFGKYLQLIYYRVFCFSQNKLRKLQGYPLRSG